MYIYNLFVFRIIFSTRQVDFGSVCGYSRLKLAEVRGQGERMMLSEEEVMFIFTRGDE